MCRVVGLRSVSAVRSGTTFVHRLLSLDPASRGPRLWELIKSVPEVPATASDADNTADRARRELLVKKQLDIRLMMGMTTMEQFHEIGHDLQEECLFGLCDEAPIGLHFVLSTGVAYLYSAHKFAVTRFCICSAGQAQLLGCSGIRPNSGRIHVL